MVLNLCYIVNAAVISWDLVPYIASSLLVPKVYVATLAPQIATPSHDFALLHLVYHSVDNKEEQELQSHMFSGRLGKRKTNLEVIKIKNKH